MRRTGTYIEGDLYREQPGCGNAVREMEQLLSRRLPYFYNIANRFLGNPADAEDAVQDALLTAYKHLNQFRGDSQLSTWLTTIVCNAARMQLRKRLRAVHVSLDDSSREEHESPLADYLASAGPSPGRLARAVIRLTPVLRKTFQLRVIQGLSILERQRF